MIGDIRASFEGFQKRVAGDGPGKVRRDKGRSRLSPDVLKEVERSFHSYARPSVSGVMRSLRPFCKAKRFRVPSRATLYQLMKSVACPFYRVSRLPPHVLECLYNLAAATTVPGHQLAFYCFNYGSTQAVAFAAGLPWICLYQAGFVRGWRAKSRGLLDAVLSARAS